jgi:hypothetical protein
VRRHHATIRVLTAVPLQSVPAGHGEPLDWTDATERAIRTERTRLESVAGVPRRGRLRRAGAGAREPRWRRAAADRRLAGPRSAGPAAHWQRLDSSGPPQPLPGAGDARPLTQTVRGVSDGPSQDPLAPAAPMS